VSVKTYFSKKSNIVLQFFGEEQQEGLKAIKNVLIKSSKFAFQNVKQSQCNKQKTHTEKTDTQ